MSNRGKRRADPAVGGRRHKKYSGSTGKTKELRRHEPARTTAVPHRLVAQDLIEIQARLSAGLAQDTELITYVAKVLELMDAAAWSGNQAGMPHEEVVGTESRRLRTAYTFHVSADMGDLVGAAAEKLLENAPFTVSFEPESLPTQLGFAVFAPPHDPSASSVEWTYGKDGEVVGAVPVSGISWGAIHARVPPGGVLEELMGVSGEQPGVRITLYTTATAHAGYVEGVLATNANVKLPAALNDLDAAARSIIRHILVGEISDKMIEAGIAESFEAVLAFAEESQDIGATMAEVRRALHIAGTETGIGFDAEMAELVAIVMQMVDIKTKIAQAPEVIEMAHRMATDSALHRYELIPFMTVSWPRKPVTLTATQVQGTPGIALLARAWVFFHMCMQTITATHQERAPRATARRWRDMPLPKQVTVIKLRRTSSARDYEGETDVRWRHRWVVRGHWRLQPCGPGRTERRPTWIHEHVKGPEGLPLIVTDKVYDLVR